MNNAQPIITFRGSNAFVGNPDFPLSEIQVAEVKPVLTENGKVGLIVTYPHQDTVVFECERAISPLNSWYAGKFLEKCLRRPTGDPLFIEVTGGNCKLLDDVSAIINRQADDEDIYRLSSALVMTVDAINIRLAELSEDVPSAERVEEIAHGLKPWVVDQLIRDIRYALEDGTVDDPYEVQQLSDFARIPLACIA